MSARRHGARFTINSTAHVLGYTKRKKNKKSAEVGYCESDSQSLATGGIVETPDL